MLTALATLGIVAAVVALGVWLDRRLGGLPFLPRPEVLRARSRRGLPDPAHAPGRAPATALRLDAAGARAAAASQRCDRCRATMRPARGDADGAARGDGADRDGPDADHPGEPIAFGGRRLRAVALRCPACGAARSLYVAPREPDGA